MVKKYPIFKTLNRLIKEVYKKDKLILLLVISYTFFSGLLPIFSVYLPKFLITEITSITPSLNESIKIILIFTGLVTIFGFLEKVIHSNANPRLMLIRIDYLAKLFRRLSMLDYKYCEDPKFLDIHEDAIESCSGNNNGFEMVMKTIFTLFARFATIIMYIIIISQLSFLVLLAIILSVSISMVLSLAVKKFRYEHKNELNHASRKLRYFQDMTHDFSYGKDIRMYNFQEKIKSNYTKEIISYINVFKKIKNKEYFLGFIDLFFLLISDFVLYYILISKVINGLSIADFSMYLVASISLAEAVKLTANNTSIIIGEGMYINDYFKFMEDMSLDSGGSLSRIMDDTLEIEFKNVSFKYPNTDNWIFQNLNLLIPKRQKLAVVGINGAGKTTLVKLILGLFEPTSGEILINGINIKDFDKFEYYKMFSVVFQEINILSYTIRENITLGLEEGEKKIWDVLDRVGLKEKVESLDKQLDNMMLRIIDEKGAIFSGGENQKLAIARALYKDGNAVILDEPTAALDALAELEIYQGFNDLVKDKTAIYVSHRLASTKFCDKIALFKDSNLVEYGNHEELMQLKKEYYNMFTIQGKYYQGGEEHEEY